jgi:hypothetical protein
MSSSERGSGSTEDGVVSAVLDGYRASGHRCRAVRHGPDTYVRVQGGGKDGLVWVRDGDGDSDAGLSRFAIECERYGVADRDIVSTAADDAVAPYAAALGIEFSGPAALAAALRAVEVPVPFGVAGTPADAADGNEPTPEADGSAPRPWFRLVSALLSVLVFGALGAAVFVP